MPEPKWDTALTGVFTLLQPTERRSRSRKRAVVFQPELRDQLVEAAHTGASKAIEEFNKTRAPWIVGVTPEQHVEHHKFLHSFLGFWSRLGTTIQEGFWAGLKRLVTLLMMALAAAALITMAGSALSPSVRHWIATLLIG